MYIDVHTHLSKLGSFQDILDICSQSQVKRVIANGINDEDNKLIASWEHPVLRRAYGLHPCSDLSEVETILSWLQGRTDFIAIGEIGLDKHWKEDNFAEQLVVFRKFLQFAESVDKPVIIHSRKAEAEVLEEVRDLSIPVVLHAFGGSTKLVDQGIAQKCYFSITSNLERSEQMQHMVARIPLKLLLTETDAPYMPRIKGEESRPQDVVFTVQKIAQIKGITVQECAQLLYLNYMRLFGSE